MESKKSGKFKKTLILFLVCLLVLIPAKLSWAEEVVLSPTPTPIEAPSSPPVEPTAPPLPEAPTLADVLSPTPTPTEALLTEEPAEEAVGEVTPSPTPAAAGITVEGNVGDTLIETETATNSVVLLTTGNSNLLEESVVASESGSVSVIEESQAQQDNQAEVGNRLEQATVTGGNSASSNVGDSQIVSGDANTSGTVITALNTNLEGVSFSEFNVSGEQEGDLILDFSNCLTEEAGSPVVTKSKISDSFQNNEAALENTLVLSSDSGKNQTNLNTQGDSTIQTGNANVAALVLTFLNNNLAGNIVLGVVNIFGSLVGDIIIPEEALKTKNLSETEKETSLVNFQNNEAEIENNLFLTANTGENEGKDNTDGKTMIETGEATVDTKTVNVVNNNLAGGSWWIVLINQAGEWIGKILGASEGANFAGAEGVEFKEDEDGEITVSHNESGPSTATTEQVQTNEAQIVNNLELSANSGQNQANKNTGGDSVIRTGNARVVASLLNFVNNNISSQSKILITVINVFGRWIGNFLPPGSEKEIVPPPDNPSDNPADEPSGSEDEDEAIEDFVFDDEEVEMPTPILAQGRRVVSWLLPAEPPENQTLSIQTEEKPLSQKPVRINLAWLLVTIPLLFLTGRLKKLLF